MTTKPIVLRRLAIVAALAMVGVGATEASGARRVGTLPIVTFWGAMVTPGFDAIVSDASVPNGPPGEPYYAKTVGRGPGGRAAALSTLGFSSQPLQVAIDPRSGTTNRAVYSVCPGGDRHGRPICSLFAQPLVGGTGHGTPVTDTPEAGSDRFPSAYRGAVAFARSVSGRDLAELRYVGNEPGAASRRLAGGPRGSGEAGPTGVALRGSRVAYVWRWKPSSGPARDTLQIQVLDQGKPNTVVSVSESSGRVIGPVWKGDHLLFAVRRVNGSRWYRYDPSTRRFGSASAPSNIVGFTIGGSALFWQTGTSGALRSGLCAPQGGCGVYSGGLPRFRSARRPA